MKCVCGAEIVSGKWDALDLRGEMVEIRAFTCTTDGCSGNVKQIHEAQVRRSKMQPFQQRVVDEKRELDDKIHKLHAFVGGTIFAALPDDERSRMSIQLQHMAGYSDILGQRIAAFGRSNECRNPRTTPASHLGRRAHRRDRRAARKTPSSPLDRHLRPRREGKGKAPEGRVAQRT